MWGGSNVLRYASLSTNHVWSSAASFGPQITSTNSVNGSGQLLRSSGASTTDFFDDNCYPRVAYANSNIYVVYADLSSITSTTDRGDIFLIEAAVNWTNHNLSVTSGPRKVNNDRTQTDQWNPSIAANPSGTELFIGYYSRQEDPVSNSWIKAYGAKAYITNGLAKATFECIPISLTNFQPVFAGTSATSNNVWTFDPVWPAAGACIDTNDVYQGPWSGGVSICPSGPFLFPHGTGTEYVNFCADDYTWCAADNNYFYFAWCDRTRKYQNTRADADINFAKVRQ